MNIVNPGSVRGRTLDVPPPKPALIVGGFEYPFEIKTTFLDSSDLLPGSSPLACFKCNMLRNPSRTNIELFVFSFFHYVNMEFSIPICDSCKNHPDIAKFLYDGVKDSLHLLNGKKSGQVAFSPVIRWATPPRKP